MEQATCKICGGPGGEKIGDGDMGIIAPCDSCYEKKQEQERGRLARERQQRRDAWWKRVVPPEYQQIDIYHTGLDQTLLEAAKLYDPILSSRKGMGFVGATGAGKTRILFYVLKKCHDAGDGVYYMNHVDFVKAAQDALSSDIDPAKRDIAQNRLSMMKRKTAVLIDDIGKGRSTETGDEALESLVEFRTSRGLPILWSTNAGGDWFDARFGADRGEPIRRKLNEYSQIIIIDKKNP